MRIEIEIPKEFEEHYNQDKFKDSLERIMADIKHSLDSEDCDYLCAGRYEYETIEMLEKAFENSKSVYSVDKIVKKLEENARPVNVIGYGTTYEAINKDVAIEIVKQGGISDDVCEWRMERIVVGMPRYMSSCCNKKLDMPVSAARELRYCPYCGKKIKVVE